MSIKVEYRVRPVTRYIVTRYHEEDRGAGVETIGEYPNPHTANRVAKSLAESEVFSRVTCTLLEVEDVPTTSISS